MPIPNAIAPKAPWVLVWESPQAIVVPGCVIPCSGPTMWTIPCLPVGAVEEGDPELGAVPAQLLDHGVGERIGEGLAHLVGGNDMVDGREGAVRHGDLQAQVAQHPEGLRARDLVDQVGADKELGLAVGQGPDGVGVPDFLEKGFGHGEKGRRRCTTDVAIAWEILVWLSVMPREYQFPFELRHLVYFREVARQLHFRRAAEALAVAQPALSRQIAQLEAALGVAALRRGPAAGSS